MRIPLHPFAALFMVFATTLGAEAPGLHNPAIDPAGYQAMSAEATAQRINRRVTEAEFLRMRAEPGTVVLDARSRQKYELLHIDGAINLSFPDITVDSLARVLPDLDTRILIYCNNNFANAPEAFPTKAVVAPLNIPTYITLYSYGYRNVYELGPLLDVHATRLPLVSTAPGDVAAAP
jgi:hypothetical protein